MAVAPKVSVINAGNIALPSFMFAGMPLGFIVSDTTGQNWQLTVSSATVNHTTVEKCIGNPQLRWLAYSGGGGLSAIADQTTLANVSGVSALPTATSAANMRTMLGVQASSAVAISGGTIAGVTISGSNNATGSAQGLESPGDKSFDDSRSWARAQWALAKALATDLTSAREIPVAFLGINAATVPANTEPGAEGGGVQNNVGGAVERMWTTTFQAVKTKSWAIFVQAAFQVPTSGKVSEAGIIESASANFAGPACRFAASTTKYLLRGGSADTVTAVNADTAFHDFCVVNDKTNVTMYIDSANPVSFPTSQLAADDARGPMMFGTDIGSVKVLRFWVAWV